MTMIVLQYGLDTYSCDTAGLPLIPVMMTMAKRAIPGAFWVMDERMWGRVREAAIPRNLRVEKDGQPWFMGCPVSIHRAYAEPMPVRAKRALNSAC